MSLWRDTKIYYCLTSKQLMGDILRLLNYHVVWQSLQKKFLLCNLTVVYGKYANYIIQNGIYFICLTFYVVWWHIFLLCHLTGNIPTLLFDRRCTYDGWCEMYLLCFLIGLYILCCLMEYIVTMSFDRKHASSIVWWKILTTLFDVRYNCCGFFFWGGELYILCCLIRDILTMSFDIVFQVQFPAEDVIEGVSSVLNQVIQLVKGRVPLL